MNRWLNFGGDPVHRLDRGIVFRIRHYWEIRKVVNKYKSAAASSHWFILIRQTVTVITFLCQSQTDSLWWSMHCAPSVSSFNCHRIHTINNISQCNFRITCIILYYAVAIHTAGLVTTTQILSIHMASRAYSICHCIKVWIRIWPIKKYPAVIVRPQDRPVITASQVTFIISCTISWSLA